MIDYRVEVKRLQHRPGTREVVQSDVARLNTVMKQTTVSDGLGNELMMVEMFMARITSVRKIIKVWSSIFSSSHSLIGCREEVCQ